MASFDLPPVVDIAGAIAFITGSFLVVRSTTVKQTINQQATLIKTLEQRIKSLEDQGKADKQLHIVNAKAISQLEGQLQVYKEIPLVDIAKSMTQLTVSNEEILQTLKNTLSDNKSNNARLRPKTA